jgi:hypothetical protein
MNVHFIRKWRASMDANCPAIYLLERPVHSISEQQIAKTIDRGAAYLTMNLPASTLMVVQGWKLNDAELDGLQDVAPGENAVRVPADVLQGIRVPRFSWDNGTIQLETSLQGQARTSTRVAVDQVLIVQGWCIDNEIRGQLQDLADDEDAVVVPVDVVAGIKIVPNQGSA